MQSCNESNVSDIRPSTKSDITSDGFGRDRTHLEVGSSLEISVCIIFLRFGCQVNSELIEALVAEVAVLRSHIVAHSSNGAEQFITVSISYATLSPN